MIVSLYGFSNLRAQAIDVDAIFLGDIEQFFLNDLNLNDPASSPAWIQLMMTNSTGQAVNVYLDFNFFANQVLLASGTTVVFTLNPGQTTITNQQLGIGNYQFESWSVQDNEVTNIATQIAQTGALPSQLYELVVDIVLAGQTTPEDNVILSVQPDNPTQVQLIAPGIPAPDSPSDPLIPTNFSPNPTFSYDTNSQDVTLIVVEWPDGVDQETAFNGPPIIFVNIVGGINTFTPQGGFFPFEVGKTYLWGLRLNISSTGGLTIYESEKYAFKFGSPGSFNTQGSDQDMLISMLYDLFSQEEVDGWFSNPDVLQGYVFTGVITQNNSPSSLEEFNTAIQNWIAAAIQVISTIQ